MHDSVTIPIDFACYNDLVSYTNYYVQNEMTVGGTISFLTNPPIADMINAELQAYGLPNATCFIVVRRNDNVEPNKKLTHVDCFTHDTTITHKISVIVPIENCEKSPMYWYDGNYTIELAKTKTGETYPFVRWNDEPIYFHEEYINSPKICNIDMPHSACGPSDGSYRTVLTFRLEGNPSFDDIQQMLLTKNNQ